MKRLEEVFAIVSAALHLEVALDRLDELKRDMLGGANELLITEQRNRAEIELEALLALVPQTTDTIDEARAMLLTMSVLAAQSVIASAEAQGTDPPEALQDLARSLAVRLDDDEGSGGS